MPPKANMPLYCSRVWLKMQRKGMAPATKNLAKLVIRRGKRREQGFGEDDHLLLVCSMADSGKVDLSLRQSKED